MNEEHQESHLYDVVEVYNGWLVQVSTITGPVHVALFFSRFDADVYCAWKNEQLVIGVSDILALDYNPPT
jgi:hypothetical protein